MSALRKCDREFRERAVRIYRDRLEEPGESKPGAAGGDRDHHTTDLDLPKTLKRKTGRR